MLNNLLSRSFYIVHNSHLSGMKYIIKSSNKIIWKGKDKVNRRALINNIENGGLKMIQLEPLIQVQKMSFFKRYVDPEYVADWKLVLDTFLKPLRGPYLLKCIFSLSDLPIKVSPFYDECLTLWSKFNSTMPEMR